VLTLESEGPQWDADGKMIEGKTAKYRDVIEWKSDDHRVLSSHSQGPDGQWQHFMTAHYRRMKRAPDQCPAGVLLQGGGPGGRLRHVAGDAPVDQFDDAVAARRQPRIVGDDQEGRADLAVHAPQQREHVV
jgi:hypothetical protein